MRIVLVRHGQTEWSAAGRHTSTTDVPLTEAGRAAAAALPLRDREFALVLSSPRLRAKETCELAGLNGEIDADLAEFVYGDYEGLTTKEIREQRPWWSLWRDGCPGGETPAQVGERVDRIISRALWADGDVALFAHGHVLRVLGARWLGLPASSGARFALDTASLCELGFERENRVVWKWNVTHESA